MRQGRPAGWRAAITIQFMRLEMPKIRVSNPDKRASTGSYSDAVLIDGWLYISGQGPLDLGTGEVVHGTIEEETRRTLEHIGSILKAATFLISTTSKGLTRSIVSSSREYFRRARQSRVF
jgi:enamine deaminase RidA (YjgF/YER057c/UK114 family)